MHKKQVKAVIHAAVESKRNGFDPQPEIMVPLVRTPCCKKERSCA